MFAMSVYAHILQTISGKTEKGITFFVVCSNNIQDVIWFCGANTKIEKYISAEKSTYYYTLVQKEDREFKRLVERCINTKIKISLFTGERILDVLSIVVKNNQEDIMSDFIPALVKISTINAKETNMRGIITLIKNNFKIDKNIESMHIALDLYNCKRL